MSRQEQKESGLLNAAGVSYGGMIRARRKQKGLNQEELGALVRVGKNAVGAWESGRSRPDLNSVPVICEALGISLEEFYGTGKKRTKPTEMQQGSEPPKRKLIRLFMNELFACAGPSFSIGETRGEPVWIAETPLTASADELIRVSGDSMEPEFHDGDYVLVRHGASLHPGEIGVFTNGDAGYIKVYQRDGLHSLNPAYPTIVFSEGDEVRCVGKVLGIAGEDLFAREEELIGLE